MIMRLFCFLVVFPSLVFSAQGPLEETWDALYIGKDKIGYTHMVATKIFLRGEELIFVENESVMNLQRFGQATEVRSNQQTYETKSGKVVRLESRSSSGGQAKEVLMRGELSGSEMKLVMTTEGVETPKSMPWPDDVLGPYAQERTVRKHASRGGDEFEMKIFVAEVNRIATVKAKVGEIEETSMLDGVQKLRRVESEMDVLPGVKTVSWVNGKGETLKSFADMVGGVSSYRVPRDTALAEPSKAGADFGVATMVKLAKPIENAYERPEISYRLKVEGGEARKLFPEDEHQSFLSNPTGGDVLVVRRVTPDSPSNRSAQTVGPEFLKSNNYLQSDDARIGEIAGEISKKESDPWRRAQLMETWVHDRILKKDFSTGFATAAEVAKNLEGDCTEHAVLLAALARAAGIPSRVAAGMLYVDSLQAFGGHMWTEVFVKDRWIPLDAVMGLGFVDATHIKITDSSLEGVDAMMSLMPILQVVSKVSIEPLEAGK